MTEEFDRVGKMLLEQDDLFDKVMAMKWADLKCKADELERQETERKMKHRKLQGRVVTMSIAI